MRRTTLRLAAICAGVLVLTFGVGYVVAVRILFPPLAEPKNGIVVPRLVGMTVPVAEGRLRELGLRVTDATQIAHPSVPAGIIIAQSPLPGQQLRMLGAVHVGVSSGPPPALPAIPAPVAAPDTTPPVTAPDTMPPDTLKFRP